MNVIMLSQKLYKYLREEGIESFLTRAVNDIISPIYKAKKVIFYKNEGVFNEREKNANGIGEKINVRMAAPEDINVLEQIMYQDRSEIRKRFERGNRCFVAQIGEKIVHYAWVSFHKEYILSINKWMELADDEAYIYNVRTLSGFRGQGIFPAVLNRVCEQLRIDGYKKILASVQSDNAPSQKAFEKAGFKRSKKIRYLKIFGYKRYNHEDFII